MSPRYLNPPDTRFARNGEFNLAYQVLGDGPTDLVYLPGWAFNVEGNWLVPEIARFLERLSSFSRLVVVDRRGTGCSDRLSPGLAPTLEELVDDLRAVTRAARSGRVVLFGVQEGAFIAMLAAAMHPDRFSRLVLYGASPSWRKSDELPWEWSDEQWEDQLAAFSGTDASEAAKAYLRDSAPSLADDPAAIRRVAMLQVLTQSPGEAAAEARRFSEVDLRDLLPVITVPTLVLHRTDDPAVSVDSGRYLADHIDGATLVELPGEDSLPWIGHADAVLDEIEGFVAGSTSSSQPAPSTRTLATILFTDIVNSTQRAAELGDRSWRDLIVQHHRTIRGEISRYRGYEIDTAGDGFFATFEGPARAVECAVAIGRAVHELGIDIRAGVHTGEVETIEGKVSGIAVHIGARIAALAGPSEVLVSSTVKDLVAGSGLSLDDAGEHELKGLPDRWQLYRVITS